MKLSISLINGETTEHDIQKSMISIGRSSQCDVVINHESMSRKHCLVEFEDGQIYVTDLGSTNGVSIDGVRIKENEKTFYLNSLPLVIGAAQVSIDLTDHNTRTLTLSQIMTNQPTPAAPQTSKGTNSSIDVKANSTGSHKNTTQYLNTKPKVVVENKATKTKTTKTSGNMTQSLDEKKKKEIFMASIAVVIFLIMVAWYFNQN